MFRRLGWLSLVFLVPALRAGEIQSASRGIDAAVAKIKPAVVQIHVVSVGHEGGREVKQEAAGSGVIINKRGDIITNHHVAGHAVRMFCILANKEEIEAELLGTDPMSDIAVLRLKTDGKREFPFAKFADSSRIKVGDPVLAVGSPMALSQSVTAGVVSNPEMVMPSLFWQQRFTLDGEDVGALVRWIGHDAAIYGGNSGGALVNLRGEVIGINEISYGLGGAVPANLAWRVAEQIIQQGKVTRSWFGLEVQPAIKSRADQAGVLISGAVSDGPAAQAGFQSGDMLLRIGGHRVSVRYAEQLPLFNQMLTEFPIGKPVEAVVLREGREITLHVTPIEREAALPKTVELKAWGVTARNLSFLSAKELKRADRDGVLASSVLRGGPCDEAKPALRPGDVIEKVNDRSVKNLADLLAVTAAVTAGQTEPVAVLVAFDRQARQFLSVVKVGLEAIGDPGLEIKKAWLPVATQVITRPLAEQLGIADRTGVRITEVYTNSVAAKAGLRVGDLIVKLDGHAIPAANPEDEEVFSNRIRQYKIGAVAELTILRDKNELIIPVELVRASRLEREMKKYRDDKFEFTVRDLSFQDLVDNQWPENQPGVLVDAVTQGSWAALGHLAAGDLLLAVDGAPITGVPALEKKMTEIEKAKPKFVVLQVQRGIHRLFVELEANWDGTATGTKAR